MVSLLRKSQSQWLSFRPMSPKIVEDQIGLAERSDGSDSYIYSENSQTDFNSQILDSEISSLLTNENPDLLGTSQISLVKSTTSLRTSIQLYKSKSALKIQLFYRQKKVQKKLKKFMVFINKTLNKYFKRNALSKLKKLRDTQENAAKVIQKYWLEYKNSLKPSENSKKHLLSRTLRVGFKLIKIQNFIEKVVHKRKLSVPVSPILTPIKRVHKRNHSNILSNSSLDDSQDTGTSSPSRFISPDTSLESFPSLLKKKSFKVRTKKSNHLVLSQIAEQLSLDEQNSTPWESDEIESVIPKLLNDSKFWLLADLTRSKRLLQCEYSELIKG